MKIFRKDEPRTVLEIWQPRYSSAYKEAGERVALLAKYKIDQATPWVQIVFTKAKHLEGQRYCIERRKAQGAPIDTNGKIACYAVPMSWFEPYELANEIVDTVNSFGW